MNIRNMLHFFSRREMKVSISGIDADGRTVPIIIKDGRRIVPNRAGSKTLRITQPTIELDLTHDDGEAILITRRLAKIHGALLTVDTTQIEVTGAEPMEPKRWKPRTRDHIKSFEVNRDYPIRLMITGNATPVHRELRGFLITSK